MNDDNEKLFGDKKIPFKVMMKRIGHYVIPEWKAFAFAFFFLAFFSLFAFFATSFITATSKPSDSPWSFTKSYGT